MRNKDISPETKILLSFAVKGHGGFIAMMPVSDEEFLVAHQPLNLCNTRGIPDPVQPVNRSMLIRHLTCFY